MGIKIDLPICGACHAPIEGFIRPCRECRRYFHSTLKCQEIHSRLCPHHRFSDVHDFKDPTRQRPPIRKMKDLLK
ncbi:MAG: hypothetical protein ACXAC7_24540 [Candidatus Hodarchaeales archaeon]|jgi:hypothetical protein